MVVQPKYVPSFMIFVKFKNNAVTCQLWSSDSSFRRPHNYLSNDNLLYFTKLFNEKTVKSCSFRINHDGA